MFYYVVYFKKSNNGKINRVMSSSGNVWVVLRIQQICNTTRHKSQSMGFSRSTNALKEIGFQQSSASYDASEKYITPQDFLSWGVFL